MKKMTSIALVIFLAIEALSQETVTDFDGNVYQTVQIGSQIWMKENLRALHYSDGTSIPEVASYNDSDSLAAIYGLLYTWNAAMKETTEPMAQGACPAGWHLPAREEYVELENFLGGAAVAGDKMKDTTPDMWTNLSASSTNSSGFSARPAGEYDPYQFHIYRLLGEYAVFWTSTQVNTSKAVERYITGSEPGCSPYNWMKIMKYSLRCVKNNFTGESSNKPAPGKTSSINHEANQLKLRAAPGETLREVAVYSTLGKLIWRLQLTGDEEYVSINDLPVGVWIASLTTTLSQTKLKFVKMCK